MSSSVIGVGMDDSPDISSCLYGPSKWLSSMYTVPEEPLLIPVPPVTSNAPLKSLDVLFT